MENHLETIRAPSMDPSLAARMLARLLAGRRPMIIVRMPSETQSNGWNADSVLQPRGAEST